MAPETFLRVLGPKPYKVAYVQPSPASRGWAVRRESEPIVQAHAAAGDSQAAAGECAGTYLESLGAIGIDLRQHDIKFEEDNWESPTLGAWGIGWQVMLDGLEITQFTYFQQCGGIDLDPICAELTYGLERIAAFLQDVDSIYDIVWARDPLMGASRNMATSDSPTSSNFRFTTLKRPMLRKRGNTSSFAKRSAKRW